MRLINNLSLMSLTAIGDIYHDPNMSNVNLYEGQPPVLIRNLDQLNAHFTRGSCRCYVISRLLAAACYVYSSTDTVGVRDDDVFLARS
ncbi:hypothetical protein GWI33_018592 [Rhynchophorus ferrugineus]|uniref:Uncharacterized protein n=1 Tax=Rhynchophorus ferrugineus TaxID=354439 RepID=A0A834M2C2_RHYFE|nr:hypothetical protein GWI33_018592 [Rhynchophorus ferrugineus]